MSNNATAVEDEEMKTHDEEEEQPNDDMVVEDEQQQQQMEEEEAPAPEEVDETGDRVVKRYDVFISQTLTNNLYLLQYPLRPKHRPYDFNAHKDMRFKKDHKKLEIDFEINTSSEHYDDGASTAPKTFTLSSTPVPLKANYAIGVLRANQLHLTPLQNILQLRPNLEYLNDDSNAKEKVVTKKEEKKTKQPEIVQATFRTKAEELARQKSFSYLKEKEDQEKPISIEYFQKTEEDSLRAFEELFEKSFSNVEFDMTPRRYLDTLVPYKEDAMAQIKKSEISLDLIRNTSKPELQMMVAFMSAKILHLSRIRELSEDQLLSLLQQTAVLVDNRWVVRSDTLDNTNPRYQACRDYMLYLLETKKKVHRVELMEATKLGEEKVYTMLKDIAVVVKEDDNPEMKRYWQLKLPEDTAFCNAFPEVVARQKKEWKQREPIILKNASLHFKNFAAPKKQGDGTSSTTNTPASYIPKSTIGDESDRVLRDLIKEALLKLGVLSKNALKQKISMVAPQYASIADDHLEKVILSIAKPFANNTAYIVKEGPRPEYEKFRTAFIACFEEKKKAKKQEILDYIKSKVNEDISPAAFAMITNELTTLKSNVYSIKTGE